MIQTSFHLFDFIIASKNNTTLETPKKGKKSDLWKMKDA